MKKEYSAPKLVNILAVGAGKSNQTAERMGQKVDYIVNGHVLVTPKISNIVHGDGNSLTTHIKQVNNNKQISYTTPTMTTMIPNDTIYLTNTPASEQIGPS